jgi:hypothetical protein
MTALLTRDEFRTGVFARDHHACVLCPSPAQDAHHVMERRLWPDGGYYLHNGVSLCGPCHLKAESTEVMPRELASLLGWSNVLLPPHLYRDQEYDKWGNPVLPNGTRLRGELFFDENVQKVIKPYLPLFLPYVKYPRTYHLPWSPGATEDDRVLPNVDHFVGKEVVVTEKMDGENTSIYCDHIHARSIDGLGHVSQHWVKNLYGTIRHDIPMGWRVCGENLFATHSLSYHALPSYFLAFSVWNDVNRCLSWDDSLEWFALLNLLPVRVLYRGVYDEAKIKTLWDQSLTETREGYIVRLADAFDYARFRQSVAKFVRPDHVQTSHNWKRTLQKNSLAN